MPFPEDGRIVEKGKEPISLEVESNPNDPIFNNVTRRAGNGEPVEKLTSALVSEVAAAEAILDHFGLNLLSFSGSTLDKCDKLSATLWDLRVKTNVPETVSAFRKATWQNGMKNINTEIMKVHLHQLKLSLDACKMLTMKLSKSEKYYDGFSTASKSRLKEHCSPRTVAAKCESQPLNIDALNRKQLQKSIVKTSQALSKQKNELNRVNARLKQYQGVPPDRDSLLAKISAKREELENVRESYASCFNRSLS